MNNNPEVVSQTLSKFPMVLSTGLNKYVFSGYKREEEEKVLDVSFYLSML